MDITLNIKTNDNWDFFTEFDRLGELQKQIWMTAVWWVKRFPSAFPKQKTIATEVGCSRKHVNNTFKKFERLGWLYQSSRGNNRTKVLGIPTHLTIINPFNRKALRSVEVTAEVTHSISNIKERTSMRAGVFSERFGQKIGPPKQTLLVPDYIQKTKLSLKKKLKLSLLPQNIYQNALETTKRKHALGVIGNDPERIERYMIGTAFKMAKKAQIPVNWGIYYESLQQHGLTA